MAFGTMSPMFFGIAAVLVIVAIVVGRTSGREKSLVSGRLLFGSVGAVALAATAVLFLLIRARHDPAINQGNPTSLRALAGVIARKQYDVAPLWPRRASCSGSNSATGSNTRTGRRRSHSTPSVMPMVWRTIVTVGFAVLGLFGAGYHREIDRRGWLAVLILTLCGSLGVIVYLNLRASPSFGWGVLAGDALREARERDYFFVLGFVGWGIWAGIGAVALARRWFRTPMVGVLVAALPIVLNWDAVSRRHEPGASEPLAVARALLGAAPLDAVLFVAGDNDTYPLWYAQEVERLRRDVTVVTLPLLPARWYVEELERRHQLLSGVLPVGQMDVASAVAKGVDATWPPSRGRADRVIGRPTAAWIVLADCGSRGGRGWPGAGGQRLLRIPDERRG